MTTLARGPYAPIQASRLIVCDTETTGLHAYGNPASPDPQDPDRICSIALLRLIRLADGWAEDSRLHVRLDPGRPIGEQAARINGMHWSGDGTPCPPGSVDLAGLPRFEDVAGAVMGFIGTAPACCHNTVFDVGFLDAELARAGRPPLDGQTYCTKKAYSDALGQGRPHTYVPSTGLDKLAPHLGIDASGRPAVHDAMADVQLTVPCLLALDCMGWMVPEPASDLPHRIPADMRRAA